LGSNRVLADKKARLAKRAVIIQEIRSFFIEEGYLETDTPLLLPTVAPEAYIEPVLAGDRFLQTSPEICMKRLLAAGYEKLFQLSHCWRGQERGRYHLPEFSMLEWYRAGADYQDLMDETMDLVRHLIRKSDTGLKFVYLGETIDVSGDWARISVREAFSLYGDMALEEALERDEFDLVMVERIEPQLGKNKPVFIYDYPACRGALARLKESDPTVAERFELYIAGIELANGFSELIDPLEQRVRFLREIAAYTSAPIPPLPEKFLAELEGMPPAAGIALGIDRLVMLLTDAEAIDDVVAFTPEDL
jgi:lysyl-tRNA synthetase class 2